MVKTIFIFTFLTIAFPFNSYADDSERIDHLEKMIQETNSRLSKIESLLNNPSNAQEQVKSSDGWMSIKNWRLLTDGMSDSEVKKILGEPQRLDGGAVAFWYYKNGGKVVFINGKISTWREPLQ